MPTTRGGETVGILAWEAYPELREVDSATGVNKASAEAIRAILWANPHLVGASLFLEAGVEYELPGVIAAPNYQTDEDDADGTTTTTTTVTPSTTPTPSGGVTLSEVLAHIYDWAHVGNTDRLPNSKLPPEPTDAEITAAVAREIRSWSPFELERFVTEHSGGGGTVTDAQIDQRIAEFARAANVTAMNPVLVPEALIPNTIARVSQIPTNAQIDGRADNRITAQVPSEFLDANNADLLLPGGGDPGYALLKNSMTDGDAGWFTLAEYSQYGGDKTSEAGNFHVLIKQYIEAGTGSDHGMWMNISNNPQTTNNAGIASNDNFKKFIDLGVAPPPPPVTTYYYRAVVSLDATVSDAEFTASDSVESTSNTVTIPTFTMDSFVFFYTDARQPRITHYRQVNSPFSFSNLTQLGTETRDSRSYNVARAVPRWLPSTSGSRWELL